MTEFVRQDKLDRMKRNWSGCFRCPLSTLRNKVVFGSGKLGAPIMLIGEAPGKDEDLAGEPFIGPAGELLDKILSSVGLSRDQIWISNTCLCRPKSTEEGRENRAPLADEINSCSPRLKEEIDIVKPHIIVLCGNTPLFWATGLKGITKHRGKLEVTIKTPSTVVSNVFATYHPAALFHGSLDEIKKKKWAVYEDWQHIKEAMLEQQQTSSQQSKDQE